MKTLGTLFSGGGGFDLGAIEAGYTPVWAVEYDPAIAAVYADNIGPHVHVADVRAVEFALLPRVDHQHWSPVCTRASTANPDGEESDEDLEGARACLRAAELLRPETISLENVWAYRLFRSFAEIIVPGLRALGYHVAWWHLCAADYGTPQTRRRLIMVARRDQRPQRPIPTHKEKGGGDQLEMGLLLPWNGWYAAVEDLIPTFEDSAFAAWQEKRLPPELRQHLLVANGGEHGELGRGPEEPAQVVTGQSGGRVRALLVHPTDMRTMPVREGEEPAFTVMATSGGNIWRPRARLVAATSDSGVRAADEPSQTIVASTHSVSQRALIFPGGNPGNGGRHYRTADEPMMTVVSAADRAPVRAHVPPGRTVKISPRGLGRFQDVPDTYRLPAGIGLAGQIIGNMVPRRLARAIMRSL